MAFTPPHSPHRGPPLTRGFREGCLEFILERVLHDFANAIGGILALSEHHLRNDTLDEGIASSLGLISESAQHCCHLLTAASSALDIGSSERQLIPASELCAEVQKVLKAMLPRSVIWEASQPDTDGSVRVALTEFKQRCMALVSLDLEHARQHQATVTIGYAVHAGVCWFRYGTTNLHDPDFAAAAVILMEPLVPSKDFIRCTPGDVGSSVEFGLPLEPCSAVPGTTEACH
ncbi:MAG TPA: hypothetical protein VGD78_02615 [Chthoniobacterales bacterium]